MSNKTAMQELIDFGWENLDGGIMPLIRKAEKLLEKEKKQTIEIHVECVKSGTEKEGDAIFTEEDEKTVREHIESYYNETFK